MLEKPLKEISFARTTNRDSSLRFGRRRLAFGFVAVGYVLMGILLWRLHHVSAEDYQPPGAGPDIQDHLTWIGRALRQGSAEATQTWYPEGYFFAHALYGCARDAFLAWGKTMVPWSEAAPFAVATYPRLTSRWYGWTNSLILAAAMLLGGLALRSRRAPHFPTAKR